MRKFSTILVAAFIALGMSVSPVDASNVVEMNKGQNIQIFSVDNSSGAITDKTVNKAFEESGLIVDVNNNMNSLFSKRYNKIHHKTYFLAIFRNDALILKLINKYPTIGLLTPLSMSIYSNDAKNTINISTLSLTGMARVTQIPATDPDLIEYARLIDVALHKALPNGVYLPLNYAVKSQDKSLTTEFTTEFDLEDGGTYADAKQAFEEELESELEPLGFVIPKSYNLQEDLLEKNGQDDYDFYDTYSICKFNVIFPVSKDHPEAGAFAPCSLFIYKKKDDDTVHIGFPSVENWIENLDISDEESIKALRSSQAMIVKILNDVTE